MRGGYASKIRKYYPRVMERIRSGVWYIDEKRGGKHIVIRHSETHRMMTLACSPSCRQAERRTINTMNRIERSEEHR